ncbi:unnamed protein product, partial [Meganyctiphanes norvegica]
MLIRLLPVAKMFPKLFKSFKKLTSVGFSPKVDSTVFRLHYRFTTYMLFIFCVLVTAKKMLDPLLALCQLKISENFYLVFTFVDHNRKINPLDNIPSLMDKILGHQLQHHLCSAYLYYFKGCLFYVPHLIWKTKENKILKQLLQGLNRHTILKDTSGHMAKVLRYLESSYGINGHYCMFYFLCEVLNLVNVVGQMYLLDSFFNGFFFKHAYGSEVFRYFSQSDEERGMDPLIQAFPRITKCNFYDGGSSGTIQKRDFLCILPQNNLNEKIFLVIWLWYIILTTITAAHLALRILILVVPTLRQYMMEYRGSLESQEVSHLVANLPLGDYCLLELFYKNLDLATFQDLLQLLLKSKTYGDSYKAFNREDSDCPMIK